MNKDTFLKFLSAFELSYAKITKILAAMDGKFDFASFASPLVREILGEDADAIIKNANESYFEKYMERLQEKGIGIFTCEDSIYPSKLKRLEEKPYYLFFKGQIELLREKIVAIVGTRSPSNYGIVVTERFAGNLAKAGAVIVSGLAYGVDGAAHRKALENGKTIAVLAGGFDKVYPAENHSLFEKICSDGLVLSEHRPDVKVTKFAFIQRNRIVAALSDAVLITEAGLKSGTTITKDYAMECGVPVYAVPGNITSPKSEGTNMLISTMQGICAISEETIIRDLGLERKAGQIVQLSMQESAIAQALQQGEKTIDELVEETKINISSLSSLLTTMEIKGIIKRMPGGMISLG